MNHVRNAQLASAIAFASFATMANAAPPQLQTPTPVIYLADNLDEKNQLGYCIDTIGRGFSDRLHTHSCKPEGGDVQYGFDAMNGRIFSPTYENKCASVMGVPATGVKLALLDCADLPEQAFTYDADQMEFHPATRPDLCLSAGEQSFRAGRYQKRDLILALCAETDASLRQWIVRNE